MKVFSSPLARATLLCGLLPAAFLPATMLCRASEPNPNSPAAATSTPAREPLFQSDEVFGHSVQGRALRATILGEGENVTLIFACVHGNETATPFLVTQLRAHLLRHPELLEGRRVVLVSVLNPDGLQKRTRVNAHGVDINRNYPGTWRKAKRGDSFKSGPRAASEPEAQAMMRLVKKYPPNKIVSIHQPLHCLVYTGARSRALAEVIARANGYQIKGDVGYPTPGGFGAYCDKFLHAPVVTLELPWQKPQAAWKANASALLAAIALQPDGD